VARLAAKEQTSIVPFGRYITAHCPSFQMGRPVRRGIENNW